MSITRAGAAFAAGLLLVAISAAPALACGGLIGPNGAVNLLRTTTFAGYHAGTEHYVTAFEFAGGGGAFGSLTPLPGIPTSVEKGGDWTLQRLIRETEPQPEGRFLSLDAATGYCACCRSTLTIVPWVRAKSASWQAGWLPQPTGPNSRTTGRKP